ncbi:unnamed protein product [Arctogadus glacialis]
MCVLMSTHIQAHGRQGLTIFWISIKRLPHVVSAEDVLHRCCRSDATRLYEEGEPRVGSLSVVPGTVSIQPRWDYRDTSNICLGSGAPNRDELELKLMAPLRLRTCFGTGLSRGTGSCEHTSIEQPGLLCGSKEG